MFFPVVWTVVVAFTVFSNDNSKMPGKRKANDSSAATADDVNVSPTTTTTTTSTKKYKNSSSDYQARYSGPSEDECTPQQKSIRDAILASRPRTGLSGPFGPWLAVPEIAQPAQELGRACRYGTSLSFRESELVILLTGAKARSAAEFDIHVGEALKAGISMDIIEAIPRDEQFSLQAVKQHVLPLLDNDREKAIASFASELVDTYTVTDETYIATKAAVGDQDSVLVEITSIVGYYTYVAYTLNVFRIPSSKPE